LFVGLATGEQTTDSVPHG